MKREPNYLAASLFCFALGVAVALSGCTTAQAETSFGLSVAADLGTGTVGLANGGHEVNPVLGRNPVVPSLALAAVVYLTAQWCIHHGHAATARTLYFLGSGIHFGAATVNCYELTR